jgi:HK97 family phage major capsid protein
MSLFTSNDGKAILRPEQVAALVVQPMIDRAVATQVATVVPITSNSLRVPIVTGDPQAEWTAEGAEIAVSDSTLEELNIKPRKLAGLSVISNELAADSSPAALQVVGDGLVRDLARKVDQAVFGTTTAPEAPAGLTTLAGVTTIVVGDGSVNADIPVIDGASPESVDWAVIADSHARLHNTAITSYVVSPGRFAWLSFIKESQISNRGLLQPDATSPTGLTINGKPVYVTPAVADDTVWCLPKQHTYIAVRQDASVEADRSAYFSSDRTALRAIIRIGFGVSYEQAVVQVKFEKPLLQPTKSK